MVFGGDSDGGTSVTQTRKPGEVYEDIHNPNPKLRTRSTLGIVIVLVGVLRLSQDLLLLTWFVDQADGLSFVPYLFTLIVGIAVSAIVWSRVNIFELNRGVK